jgi:hypothetical protein
MWTLRRLICGQQLVHACTYVPHQPMHCMRNVYIAKHLRRWVISERHFSLLGLLGPFYRFLFTTSFSWQEKRAHFLIMFFPTSYSTNNDAAIAFLPSHTQKELGVILPRCSWISPRRQWFVRHGRWKSEFCRSSCAYVRSVGCTWTHLVLW